MRVQVIKKDHDHGGGVLEFGTEVVSATDGSIAALLGASPGASVSPSVMIEVLKKCFKTQMESPDWIAKMQNMIPSYGKYLHKDASLCESVRERTTKLLGLENTLRVLD